MARVGGLDGVRVAASDESWVDQATATWNAFDSDTRAIIDQVSLIATLRRRVMQSPPRYKSFPAAHTRPHTHTPTHAPYLRACRSMCMDTSLAVETAPPSITLS
jgi:hypothetical protein